RGPAAHPACPATAGLRACLATSPLPRRRHCPSLSSRRRHAGATRSSGALLLVIQVVHDQIIRALQATSGQAPPPCAPSETRRVEGGDPKEALACRRRLGR